MRGESRGAAPIGTTDKSGGVLGFAVGFLVGVQFAPLPLNLAVVDGLLILLLAARVFASGTGAGKGTFQWSAPWIWLILVGSLIGMFATPLVGESMLHLARDAYAFAILPVAFWWLSSNRTRWRAVVFGMVAVGCLCSTLVITSPDARPAGTFLNPNYAGHYLAVLIVLLLATRRGLPRWLLAIVPLLVIGMLGTGSFGALLIGIVGLAYVGWNFSYSHALTRALIRGVLITAVAVVAFQGVIGSALESDFAMDSGLGENRFDKSSTGRMERYSIGLDMAAEYPFGVGPGGAILVEQALGEHELHNDYLAFLVERSVLGLVGLVGLVAGMWRRFAPTGAARAILLVVVTGSLVREALNFRHLWLALAVAFAFDVLHDRKCIKELRRTSVSQPSDGTPLLDRET